MWFGARYQSRMSAACAYVCVCGAGAGVTGFERGVQSAFDGMCGGSRGGWGVGVVRRTRGVVVVRRIRGYVWRGIRLCGCVVCVVHVVTCEHSHGLWTGRAGIGERDVVGGVVCTQRSVTAVRIRPRVVGCAYALFVHYRPMVRCD